MFRLKTEPADFEISPDRKMKTLKSNNSSSINNYSSSGFSQKP